MPNIGHSRLCDGLVAFSLDACDSVNVHEQVSSLLSSCSTQAKILTLGRERGVLVSEAVCIVTSQTEQTVSVSFDRLHHPVQVTHHQHQSSRSQLLLILLE